MDNIQTNFKIFKVILLSTAALSLVQIGLFLVFGSTWHPLRSDYHERDAGETQNEKHRTQNSRSFYSFYDCMWRNGAFHADAKQ